MAFKSFSRPWPMSMVLWSMTWPSLDIPSQKLSASSLILATPENLVFKSTTSPIGFTSMSITSLPEKKSIAVTRKSSNPWVVKPISQSIPMALYALSLKGKRSSVDLNGRKKCISPGLDQLKTWWSALVQGSVSGVTSAQQQV